MPATAPSRPEAAPRIALPWIVRLRYALAVGQLATAFAVDRWLAIDLPLTWIAIMPALTLLSNIALARWAAQPQFTERIGASRIVAAVFVLDTLCLTAILMLSGGPNNPFSLLYLVFITLSATILTKQQTWALGALATVCFGILFWVYRPIPALEMQHVMPGMTAVTPGTNLHLTGMWIGFAVAAFLVALFSGKISELLREHEASLIAMQEQLAKQDRLASLVTLAAGAAHELSTPLGTIAVVAKDLERYVSRMGGAAPASTPAQTSAIEPAKQIAVAVAPGLGLGLEAVLDDSRLIRTEVDRCREILGRMRAGGAEPEGEAPEPVLVDDLLSWVASAYAATGRIQAEPAAGASLVIPRRAVQQALSALVKNALQASPETEPVTVSTTSSPGRMRFHVADRGDGMTPQTLRHVGEPFFTTKQPGDGMGLGVFLVRTLADRLGGSLTFDSSPGKGTVATLELPRGVAA